MSEHNDKHRIANPDNPDPLIAAAFEGIMRGLGRTGQQLSDRQREEVLSNALTAGVEKGGKHLLRTLKRQSKEMLADHERVRSRFEARLQRTWGRPLNLLYMFIVIAMEAGEEHNAAHRADAVRDCDYVFDALVRLHVKACQVSLEVWHLLRAGFAAGANARWRTLHELAVVGYFIEEHGNVTAERYLLHQYIESYKEMQNYVAHSEKLGYTQLTNEEISSVTEMRDRLIQRFGPDFGNDNGWAADVIGKKKSTFTDLESAVQLDHFRPLYRLSGHSIHAGAKGLFFNLGVSPGLDLSLAGASNSGLADPGHGAANALLKLTSVVLTRYVDTQNLVTISAMEQLADEIGEAFIRAHNKVEARTRELHGLSYDDGYEER